MGHKMILNEIDFVRIITLRVLEDVTEEAADMIPEGFNNSIRWNAGHIFVNQYLRLYQKIPDELPLPEHFIDLFGYGTKPADWNVQPPSLEVLKALLREQADYIRTHFGARLDEMLIEPTELGMNTIGEIIPHTLYHEGLHTGTILALKKIIAANTLAEV